MNETFLQDLALVMIVAGVVTVIFNRLKQPVVLGYILAGLIVGPHTPPFPLIQDEHTIELMAELGMIFLMFGLGLHFSLRKLAQVGLTAVIAASLEIAVMIWLGYIIGRGFGWNTMNSLFLGSILAVSSTTIIVKALEELGKTRSGFAEIIFGILIVEDILGIALIALLSGFAATGSLQAVEVGRTVSLLVGFLGVVGVAGLLLVPRLLRYVNRFNSNEMLVVTTLALCFGVSLLALKFEYSVVLGAFLIGAIIAETRESARITHLIEPVRDMFSAVFFVAIGMLIQPAMLLEHAGPIAVITVAVVLGKISTCTLGSLIAGHDLRTSLQVGMGVAQIGEFSFIIASLGLTLGVTDDFLYPIAVTVSAITTFLTPYLMKAAEPTATYLEKVAPRSLTNALAVYDAWATDRRNRNNGENSVRRWLWTWALQLGLNLILMGGLFVFASWAARKVDQWSLPVPLDGLGGARTVLWFSAVLLALPVLVATLRKLRAVAMVLAELTVKPLSSGEPNYALRSAIANTLFAFAAASVCALVLLLGTALLPPWPVLVMLLVIVVLMSVLLWRSLVRVYAKAQVSLRDILSDTTPHEVLRPVPHMMEAAQLKTVILPAHSIAVGKSIKDCGLRNESGASIVGIQRNETSIINPSPDETLQTDDSVLLLGDEAQLESANEYLLRG
ncbi:MAG: cation:proton antiporter [FCB group bacterium]|jgi:CPA2 family monovalent cation:H+ antiporter-2|nr:cation:proton antiporter [FCB group bacterium]